MKKRGDEGGWRGDEESFTYSVRTLEELEEESMIHFLFHKNLIPVYI